MMVLILWIYFLITKKRSALGMIVSQDISKTHSMFLFSKQFRCKVFCSLVYSQVGAIHYQSSHQAYYHPLFITFLLPEFVTDHLLYGYILAGLQVGLKSIERIPLEIVDQASNKSRSDLTYQTSFFPYFLSKQVHHANMKTSEVHSQPWTLFDHGIWKSSINFAKS